MLGFVSQVELFTCMIIMYKFANVLSHSISEVSLDFGISKLCQHGLESCVNH